MPVKSVSASPTLLCMVFAASASAADPSIADLGPRLDAYYDCGTQYVRTNSAPTLGGASSACYSQLLSYLTVVSFQAQLTNPRDMQRARPDDPVVVQKVASTRKDVEARFADRVKEALAARQSAPR